MSERLRKIETPIAGVRILERERLGDHRGWFERFFCERELEEVMGGRSIVQMNRSFTSEAGTVRGVHLQRPPHAECKMVSCLSGSIFDVAVDLRAGSPTFLTWFGVELSATNQRSLWIPEGCGHAFQSLVPDVEMLYLHTACHAPAAEHGVNALDETLDIAWKMEVRGRSQRDAELGPIDASFKGIVT
jgi:dTDP-4-dehydrorhamnose 3,5-epimerase